jgi:hypothetical protein
MSDESQVQQQIETKQSDKEFNFRQIEKKLHEEREARIQERTAREQLEKEVQRLRSQSQSDDEDDSEPYVDHKKLNKTLSKFGQNTQTEIQKAMEIAKQKAKEELKQEMFLEGNPDFYDIIQQHAEKLPQRAPRLAESILKMPDTFERQQLVYNNIKALGLDKPEVKQSSVQEKIDANKRSPYYQPSNVGTAPYNGGGDFSAGGQKNAYDKMQELKNRLRLG